MAIDNGDTISVSEAGGSDVRVYNPTTGSTESYDQSTARHAAPGDTVTIARGGDNPSVHTTDSYARENDPRMLIARGGDNPSEQWITNTADAVTKKTQLQGPPLPPAPDPSSIDFQNKVSYNDTSNAYHDLAWYAKQSAIDMQKNLDTDYNARINDLDAKSQGRTFKTAQEEAQYVAEVAKLKYTYYEKYKETSARNTLTMKQREFDQTADDRVSAVMQDPSSVDAVKQEMASRARALTNLTKDPYVSMAKLKQANMNLDVAAIKALAQDNPFAAQKYFDERKNSYLEDYGSVFIENTTSELEKATFNATTQFTKHYETAQRDLIKGTMSPKVMGLMTTLKDTPMAALGKSLESSLNSYNAMKDVTVPQLQKYAADASKSAEFRQFAESRLTAFKADPHKVLENLGRYEKTPINIYDPLSIQKRANDTEDLSGKYQTNIPLLTEAESKTLGTKLSAMGNSQAAETISNIVKSVDPNRAVQIASELRRNSVGSKSEIAYLSALDSSFVEYAKRYEVLSDKKKEKVEMYASDIKAELVGIGLNPTDSQLASMQEAVKVYMGGKDIGVQEAVTEMYSKVNNSFFGKAAAGIPKVSKEFDEILTQIGADPKLLRAKGNGEPMFANGAPFDFIDHGLTYNSIRSGVTLEATSKVGQYFVKHNNAYVGTRDNKKFVLNLSKEINELAIRNSR